MPADGYWLTADDRAVLDGLIRDEKRRKGNARYGDGFPGALGDYSSTDVVIVLVPSGGIPALVAATGTGGGDEPGVATCSVVQITKSTPEIEATQAVPVEVYNWTTAAVPAGYALAVKDKAGAWVVVPPPATSSDGETVGGTDCKGVHWLRPEKCVNFIVYQIKGLCAETVTGGSVSGTYNAGSWESDEHVITGMGWTDITFTQGNPPALVMSQTPGTGSGSGDVGTAYGPVALRYVGCVDDKIAFVGGGSELCPSYSEATCDDTFLVLVQCATCPSPDIEVCDDPAYTAARRLCFHTHEIEVYNGAASPLYTFKGDAAGAPFVVTLDYKATYPEHETEPFVGWPQPYTPTSSLINSGLTEHWWYGEATGVVTESASPGTPVGTPVVFQMFLYKSVLNCDGYFGWVRVAYRHPVQVLDFSGGPPNPFPFASTTETLLNSLGGTEAVAAEVVVSENVCPDDLDPPTGGDFGCYDGSGGSLEGVANLQIIVPDGPSAGGYTATLNMAGNSYEFIPAGVTLAEIKCFPSSCLVNGLSLSNVDTSSGVCATSVVEMPSFLALFPGSVLGGTADIEVTI